MDDAAILRLLDQMERDTGELPSRNALMRATGTGTTRATRLLQEWHDRRTPQGRNQQVNEIRVGYLPDSIAKTLRHRLQHVDNDTVFNVMRLAEEAYAEGYDDGHRRGVSEGYDAAKNDPRDNQEQEQR